jgi:WD40 repeat protein
MGSAALIDHLPSHLKDAAMTHTLRAAVLSLLVLLTGPSSIRSASREPTATLAQEAPTVALAFTDDGKRLVTVDQEGRVQVWDAATGKEQRQFRVAAPGSLPAVLSTDARRLAIAATDDRVHVYDVASGKESSVCAGRIVPTCMTFDQSGTKLALGLDEGAVCLWDLSEKERLRYLYSRKGRVRSLAFSPDGKRLLGGEARAGETENREPRIRQWLPAAEDEEPKAWSLRTSRVLFAPDGRSAAAFGDVQGLRLVESATGRERCHFSEPRVSTAAFSPDGRFLAWSEADETSLQVRDALTGTTVLVLDGHEASPTLLAFSPNGKRLASASRDFSVLLWDVAHLDAKKPAAQELTDKQLRVQWERLLSDDPPTAYAAMAALYRSGPSCVPRMKEHIAATVERSGGKRVAALIADLDGPVFSQRNKAARELEYLGQVARPALEKALEARPTLELRRRIEQLIEQIDAQPMPKEQLRLLRVVELLERIGTGEAREVLEHLAEENTPTPASQDAQTTLVRMKARLH